jgi:simple sugar transport system permease protein
MVFAMIVGSALSLIPALFRVKLGASEVVPAVMMNYIIMYLLQYYTMYTFRGSEYNPQTAEIESTAKLLRLGQNSIGLYLAILVCLIFSFVMTRTRFGLEMRGAGFNPVASSYQGINVGFMSVVSILIGGALAGLGGAVEVLGGRYLYVDGYFVNYGYDGIAVAYMARNNPLGVILTAFLVSALKVGALALDRQTNVTVHYATALQGMIITLLVSPYLVKSWVENLRLKKLKDCFRHKYAKLTIQ